jgi:F0F1-type ATP synthase membrane subunit b/b'
LRKLSAASTRFISQLTPMRAQAKDETEREALEHALENAQSIVEAAKRLPPEVKEEKEKKKSEKSKN